MSRFVRMRRSMAVVLSLVLAAGPAGSYAPFLEAVYAEETRDAGAADESVQPVSFAEEAETQTVGPEASAAESSAAEAADSSVAEAAESSATEAAEISVMEAAETPAAENTETADETDETSVTEEPDTSAAGTVESDDSEEEEVPEQTSDSVDPESTAASEEASGLPEEAPEEDSEADEAEEESGEEIDPDEEILSDGSESEEEDLTSELPEVSSIESGVPYINENKEAAVAADCVIVEQDVITWKEVKDKKSGVQTNWYVVKGAVTIDSRVVVKKRINLILADGAVLTIPKGITVNRSSTNELHIYVQAEGTGRLVAGGSCEAGCAGIGGSSGMPSAPVYIHGGTITATGGRYAAGIGGGLYGDGTDINIEDGDVTAVGGSQAAGIGGGYKAGSEALTISGGTITAVAGETIGSFDQAAQAIGTGQDPTAGSGEISFILYEGAELHAGTDADNTQVYLNDEQGIQACRDNPYVRISRSSEGVRFINKEGEEWLLSKNVYRQMTSDLHVWSYSWYLVTGKITIPRRVLVSGNVNIILANDALLTAGQGITVMPGASLTIYGLKDQTGKLISDASRKADSAGIGSENGGSSGAIEIYGGDVTAVGGSNAPGIGSSSGDNTCVLIARGTVNATGGTNGAGIGGSAAVDIQGGTVTASGSENGAGIGGNGSQSAGTIRISGGKVTASGGINSAGIGGGNSGSAREVNIIQGEITATGGKYAAGIGGGNGGSGGSVSITGGTVNTKGGTHGIGGGAAGAAGDVRIISGTVLAQGGISAIGSNHFSPEDITLGDLMVSAGTDLNSLSPVTVLPGEDTRTDACRKSCIRMETCTEHILSDSYMMDENGHCFVCTRCAAQLNAEKHSYKTYTRKVQEDQPEEEFPYTPEDADYHIRECEICHYIEKARHRYEDSDQVYCTLCGGGEKTVVYKDLSGKTVTQTGCRELYGAENADKEINELDNDKYDGFYIVKGNVTIEKRIEVNGRINLVLYDDAVLTARHGIHVENGSLTIWGQEKGSAILHASGDDGYAAIGGDPEENGGTIIINAGQITAEGGKGAAGIGSGRFVVDPAYMEYVPTKHDNYYDGTKTNVYKTNGTGASITINSGTVTAEGGSNAAGIGGGESCAGGIIRITGGNVTAYGHGRGAGIGGGSYGHGGTVTITGGDVKAYAIADPAAVPRESRETKGASRTVVEGGAGIGSGCDGYKDSDDKHTVITIDNGAKVYAESTGFAPAIGQGFEKVCMEVPVDIYIYSGRVTAVSKYVNPIGGWEFNGKSENADPVSKITIGHKYPSDYLIATNKEAIGKKWWDIHAGKEDEYNSFVFISDFIDKKSGEIYTGQIGGWGMQDIFLVPTSTCTITFDGNGGSGTMENTGAHPGSDYILPACTFTAPKNRYFDGWKVSWDGRILKAGTPLHIEDDKTDLTLTAQWKYGYSIWIGNELVTPENCQDILGDGKISYDPAAGVLKLSHVSGIPRRTVKDAVLSIGQESLIFADERDLVIEFEDTVLCGKNDPANGIYVRDGSVTLRASGTAGGKLSIEAAEYGIYADKDVTVLDAEELAVRADGTSGSGIYARKGSVMIGNNTGMSGGNISIEAVNNGIFAGEDVTVQDAAKLTVHSTGTDGCGIRSGRYVYLKKDSLPDIVRMQYTIDGASGIHASTAVYITDIAMLKATAYNKIKAAVDAGLIDVERKTSYTNVKVFGGDYGFRSDELAVLDSYVTASGYTCGVYTQKLRVTNKETSAKLTSEGETRGGLYAGNLYLQDATIESRGGEYGMYVPGRMDINWIEPEDGMKVSASGDTAAFYGKLDFLQERTSIYLPEDGMVMDETIQDAKGTIAKEAVIGPRKCSLSFDPGEGSGEMPALEFLYAKTVVFPKCSFSPPKKGIVFGGWKVGDHVYMEGETIPFTRDYTAVAQWGMTWTALQERMNQGGKIVLPQDVADEAYNRSLTCTTDVVIDLNGHTIDRNRSSYLDPEDTVFTVNGGSLTIMDSKGGGKITGGLHSGIIVKHGTFTLESGEISGNRASEGGAVHVQGSDASFIMKGGLITGNTSGAGGAVYCEQGSFSISGSPVIKENTSREAGAATTGYDISCGPIQVIGPLTEGAAIEVGTSDPSRTVITSGLSEKGSIDVFLNDDPSYVIRQNDNGEAAFFTWRTATFYADRDGTKILKKASMLEGDPLASYAGLNPFDDKDRLDHWEASYDGSNGKIEVDLQTMRMPASDAAFYPVEKAIVSKEWKQLQEKIKAGGKIVLDSDVYAMQDDVALECDRDVVIDLNGHVISRNLSSKTVDGMVFKVNSGNLTITDSKGGGKITGAYNQSKGGAVWIGHGSFTMTGGEISGNTSWSSGSAVYMEYDDSSFIMSGGVITRNMDQGGCAVDRKYSYSGRLSISGSPVIMGNTDLNGSANAGCSITWNPIRVTGPLSEIAKIEVSGDVGHPITSGLRGNGTRDSFISPDPSLEIGMNSSGEAVFERLRKLTLYIYYGNPKLTRQTELYREEYKKPGDSLAQYYDLQFNIPGYTFYSWGRFNNSLTQFYEEDLRYLEMPDEDLTLYAYMMYTPNKTATQPSASKYSYGSGSSYSAAGYAGDSSSVNTTGTDQNDSGWSFSKTMQPAGDVSRVTNGFDPVLKARYGEEDDQTSGSIYVLEMENPLLQDVTFDQVRLEKYQLWKNQQTEHTVYLLPNAARILSVLKPEYVSDVIHGNVLGDEEEYDIDIFTALTEYAFSHPVVPVGSSGMLDFSTGVLTLPSLADFELYLHELSGSWLTEQFDQKVFRMLSGEQDEINRYILDVDGEDSMVLSGEISEGVTKDSDQEGLTKYWIGNTPDTAADADQTLVYLLVDDKNDEVDAFRTSVSMLDAEEEPVDVSLYIYRDSKSDRRGEEKYNVMFFDTPDGEKSLVKVITDVLEERELELPKPVRLTLRGSETGGADLPIYRISDHFMAMNDGLSDKIITHPDDSAENTAQSDDMRSAVRNGTSDSSAHDDESAEEKVQVNMFDGFYKASFDGDVFESSYTRIEGISGETLSITLKAGQDIWPEWTGEDKAKDVAGEEYVRIDNTWYTKEEAEKAENEKHSRR